MKKSTAAAALCAVAALGMSTPAFAGEVTGNNKPTPIRERANSDCAFSGLEDNNPGPGLATPGTVQNWGHSKGKFPVVESLRGASEVTLNFGDGNFMTGCNAHMYPAKGSEPTP